MKRRTGNWRVLQILATINLAVWIGIVVLLWLGLASLNNLSIVFPAVAILVITLAYLRLYQMPQKKEFRTTVTIPEMNRIVPATFFFLGSHLILRNQMASDTLVKRLLWVYSIFMLYLVVASLLGVVGVVYLPLRMDLPPVYGHDVSLYLFLVLYWTVIAHRITVRRQKKRAPPTKPW